MRCRCSMELCCALWDALCVMWFCSFCSEVETAEACHNIMCLCTDGGVVDNDCLLMDNDELT